MLRGMNQALGARLRFVASALVSFVFACQFVQSSAHAGGGPENLFLVVNSRSQNSLTIANEYIQLRHVPPGNVYYLDWDGPPDSTDIETFRDKILSPVLQAVSTRGIANQIDYIVYSSDFPTRIDFAADLPESQRSQAFLSASITSLTYLYQLVMNRVPLYMNVTANHYMRVPNAPASIAATHGFRGWYGWGPRGELLESGGSRYLLSTMLAVTNSRGNTVPDAIRYLKRATEADGSRPKGTIYYMANSNVRSTTRSGAPTEKPFPTPKFDAAIAELKRLGIAAEVEEGVCPARKNDVAGAMLGFSVVPWGQSQNKVVPGAIVENLTSFGGVFYEGTGQTVLTEFLRGGAAGSSGTVVEPYANPNKFPTAEIQLHYARGCSLAEAYYQSVWGPYQLLIVGDPLCRPWAAIPQIHVSGIDRQATVKGRIEFKPSARSPTGRAIDHFELFANGVRVDHCNPGDALKLSTEQMADGYAELRIVAVEAGDIETQGAGYLPITVSNHGRTIEATASATKISDGGSLSIRVKAPKMDHIAVYEQSRMVGTISGESGELPIDTSKLGEGLSIFRAVGISNESPPRRVLSPPTYVEIEGKAKR
jgi:hypothetical protein